MKNTILHNCKYLMLLSCISILSLHTLQAQSLYKLSAAKENLIKVSGSSNVHDWTMSSASLVSEASFGSLNNEDGVPKSLSSLSFSVAAKTLKSEHASMDTRTYKTIKADAFPQITFKLSDAVISTIQKGKCAIKATGTLTIAGVAKVIIMQVKAEVKADGSIVCQGQEKIKLTDFNIQPPSFMLGAMKVADDLTIAYTLYFKK